LGGPVKSDEVIISRDGWMIAGLAHSEYTRTHVVQQLWKYFVEEFRIGNADQEQEEEILHSVEVLQILGDMLFERYIHSKTLNINQILQKGIHLSGVDWGILVPPVAVSEYIMTMLLHFVYVHAEVAAFSENIPNISLKVMRALLTNTLNTLHRAILQLEGYSIYGIGQILTDLSFFEDILNKYFEKTADAILRNIHDTLNMYEDDIRQISNVDDEVGKETVENMKVIVDDTVKKSSILFSCLIEKT